MSRNRFLVTACTSARPPARPHPYAQGPHARARARNWVHPPSVHHSPPSRAVKAAFLPEFAILVLRNGWSKASLNVCAARSNTEPLLMGLHLIHGWSGLL